MESNDQTFRFGDFALDVAAYELRRKGRAIRLERQPMDLLILLLEQRQRLVTRGEIVDRLWGKDVFVDVETGVNTAIRKIRQALRDSTDNPQFVETVPSKGYRFVAEVEVVPKAEAAPAVEAVATPEPTVEQPSSPAAVTVDRVNRHARLALVLVAVGVTALLVLVAWRSRIPPPSATLALLPPVNLSGNPAHDYLADGLSEEIIASLGLVAPDRLNVVARTSTLRFRGTTKSAAEIGRELGADYLVESSIREERAKLRFTFRLIRAGDQVQIWSESYDRAPTNLLGLQQELSVSIADRIQLRLSPERLDTLARRQTRNAAAYDRYLRGLAFAARRTPETTRQAVEQFQAATALDPNYALAWSGLAMAFSASPLNSDARPRDVAPRVREGIAHAVAADPGLAEVALTRGAFDWHLEWNWPAAEADFRRAIELDPRMALAHLSLGHVLSQMERHSEAEPVTRRARELDPLSPMVFALSSQVAFQARDYPSALDHALQAIALDEKFWIGHMMRAQALEALKQPEASIEAAAVAERFSGQNSKPLALRGYVLAKLGRTQEAREVLGQLEAAAKTRYVPPTAFALVTFGLGDRRAALQWLDRALDERDVHLMFLPVDSKWDSLRTAPEFAALLARCGFKSSGRP